MLQIKNQILIIQCGLGIVWHESQDLGNGTSSLVRDARKVTTDEALLKVDAPEKYAMQLLNQTRGASDLIDKSDLSPEAKELAKKINAHSYRCYGKYG